MPPRPFGLHDGEGLNGARFIAGCIAAAFVEEDSRAVVDAGLRLLPDDSKYAEVARAVIEFHDAHPGDWRPCQEYLIASWGYDKWPGLCHVIPNAGVCVLALLYGRGNFARTVEIATMCGWDTDCNAGNVGTIAECCTVSIRFLLIIERQSTTASSCRGFREPEHTRHPYIFARLSAAGYRLAGKRCLRR